MDPQHTNLSEVISKITSALVDNLSDLMKFSSMIDDEYRKRSDEFAQGNISITLRERLVLARAAILCVITVGRKISAELGQTREEDEIQSDKYKAALDILADMKMGSPHVEKVRISLCEKLQLLAACGDLNVEWVKAPQELTDDDFIRIRAVARSLRTFIAEAEYQQSGR